MPRARIEPTSPCILVRRANHYTIRDHYAGNVAVWIVKLVNAWGFLGPIFLKCKCGLILLECVSTSTYLFLFFLSLILLNNINWYMFIYRLGPSRLLMFHIYLTSGIVQWIWALCRSRKSIARAETLLTNLVRMESWVSRRRRQNFVWMFKSY